MRSSPTARLVLVVALLPLLGIPLARAQQDDGAPPPEEPTGAWAPAPTPAVAPPPDPRRESYDGRPRQGWTARQKALLFPRLLLLPPKIIVDAIFYPIGIMVRYGERHHTLTRIYDALTTRDGLIGVRPIVNFVSGFRATAGLSYFDQRHLGPGSELSISLQGNVPDAVITRVYVRPMSDHAPITYSFLASYLMRDDYLYTGIGYDAGKNNPGSRYQIHQLDLHNTGNAHVNRLVTLTADGAFGLRRFGNGIPVYGDRPINEVYCPRIDGRCLVNDVDEAQVPGFHEGTQFLRLAAGLRVDSRDSHTEPSQGAILELNGDYTKGLGRDHSEYFRVQGQVVGIVDLWRRSRQLVVRVSGGSVFSVGSDPVPFSELFTLGGPDGNRGLRWTKYRDSSYLLASAEYRWPLWMWMDASLFVDYGGVFSSGFRDFTWSHMIPSVGASARVRTTQHFYLRFQVGYGIGEGWNGSIVATMGP